MNTRANDTIAAISTPMGEGGIALVRLSGQNALAVADAVFKPPGGAQPSAYKSHTVHYGQVFPPGAKDAADEVMLSVMRAPRTYTREDVVEISCHGGLSAGRKVLEACLASGARLAEPGEFTKRAFLNGRIDLSQAEAVLDIIKAETEASRRVAMGQLKGELSGKVKALRAAVLDAAAKIELTIDFPQEDVAFPSRKDISSAIGAVHSSIKDMLATCGKGVMLRHGASVVICGRPNTGKSSLMNALLRHDRVIVSPHPGTTRDVIEESVELSGIKVRISDTAGIIETTDRVELEGIKRSREKLGTADAVILMLDLSCPLSGKDDEIFTAVKSKTTVVVANKSDLAPVWDVKEAGTRFGGQGIIRVSALKCLGLDEIEEALSKALLGEDAVIPEGPVITSLRHKELLERAAECLERSLRGSDNEDNAELLASDLKEAVHFLGLITGESVEDDVLDRIFSRFCIGK